MDEPGRVDQDHVGAEAVLHADVDLAGVEGANGISLQPAVLRLNVRLENKKKRRVFGVEGGPGARGGGGQLSRLACSNRHSRTGIQHANGQGTGVFPPLLLEPTPPAMRKSRYGLRTVDQTNRRHNNHSPVKLRLPARKTCVLTTPYHRERERDNPPTWISCSERGSSFPFSSER